MCLIVCPLPALDLIAQWDNECISLSVFSMVRVTIAQWENECISLSDLSVVRVTIAQWESECVLSVAVVQFPAVENIPRRCWASNGTATLDNFSVR